MLLRSSSTPFLHHPFLFSSFPLIPSSLQLRRAFSDGHIPSLHRRPSYSTPNNAGGLDTELSFSIYNTFDGGAPLASPEEPRHGDAEQQHEEPDLLLLQDQQQRGAVQQPDHPEVPLFLARGLGIDRIASGFFTAGAGDKATGGAAGKTVAMEGVEERDEEAAAAAALDAQYKRMVDEQPGNALFLRNYAQFLHEVKGDARRAEEYYSRAMLADPADGEIMSQYAKLVWEVYRDQERCLGYFQKSVQAAPQNSHVLAAYASFLWEQDDDDLGEGEQGAGGAGAEQRAAHQAAQVRELASAAV
ncbi:unnamed protein product [Urochloa humidicola]